MTASSLPEATKNAIEDFVGLALSDPNFYLVAAVGLLAVLVLGRTFSSSVGQSRRGFLVCFVGLLVPLLTVMIGYAISRYYFTDLLPNPDLGILVAVVAGLLAGLIAAFAISKPLLNMSAMGILATAFLTYGLAFCLMFGSREVLTAVNEATTDVNWKNEKAEELKQELKQDLKRGPGK